MEFRGVQISLVLTLRELCGLRHSAVNKFNPARKTRELRPPADEYVGRSPAGMRLHGRVGK